MCQQWWRNVLFALSINNVQKAHLTFIKNDIFFLFHQVFPVWKCWMSTSRGQAKFLRELFHILFIFHLVCNLHLGLTHKTYAKTYSERWWWWLLLAHFYYYYYFVFDIFWLSDFLKQNFRTGQRHLRLLCEKSLIQLLVLSSVCFVNDLNTNLLS